MKKFTLTKRNTLAARLLLVLIAFLTMILASGFIMSRSLNEKLKQSTNELMEETAIFISTTLLGPEIVLNFIADNVENMLNRNDGFEAVKSYLIESSSPAFKENIRMFDYYTVYGYFNVFADYENDLHGFIDGGGWHPSQDAEEGEWVASERPWYSAAVAARGSIVITDPYIDPSTLMPVIAYARLLIDEKGRQLGVIGLDVPLDFLTLILGNEHITPGGYLFLLDNRLQTIVHPNENNIGITLHDTSHDISRFIDAFERGEKISLQRFTDYRGVNSLLFAQKMDNDWYIGKIVPLFGYYRDLYAMLLVIGTLGAILATVLIYNLMRLDKNQARAVSEIERRDNLLRSVNNTASILLTAKNDKTLNSALVRCMKDVGISLDADLVEVWRNEYRDGKLYAVLNYYWHSEIGEEKRAASNITEFPYSDVPSWEERFANGEYIAGPVDKLSPEDQLFFKSFGTKSILAIPVYIKERLWGFCSIDDCRNIRNPSEDEIDILRSLSYMLANTVYRLDLTTKVNEANKLVKLMLDSSPLNCEIWDSNFNILDCNEATTKFFDVGSKEEYINRISDFSPEFQPDGQRSDEKTLKIIAQVFSKGQCVCEWQHVLADGTIVPVEVTLVPIDYGNERAVIAYTRDLREHNRMMERLSETHELLKHREEMRGAINEMAVMLLSLETKSLEESLNHGLRPVADTALVDNISIYKFMEFASGSDFGQIYRWESAKGGTVPPVIECMSVPKIPIINNWIKIFKKGGSVNIDESNITGEEKAFLDVWNIKSLLFTPVFIDGKMWGAVSFECCESDRHFDEGSVELLRSAAFLCANAIIRDDLEREITSAFERVEAASRAKSDFLSAMSHEMRTPMNAIIGMTAIGKKTEIVEEKDYALNKISDASSHLLRVINDVLDMAKIEANKLELTPIEYDFERMLQKVINVINFSVDEKEQTLFVDVDKNIPRFVIGDDQRLMQVITNLMSNAVKFTPEGGRINLYTALTGEVNGECELRITVTDSGIGISSEQQDKLFHAFEQAESGISREYGGTGLGLVISKRIVELMDGEIWVESELGKGSQFIFTVKVGRSKKNPSSLLAPGVNWETVRILAVDDMPEVREQFINMFKQLKINCDVAADGVEACNIIEKNGGYDIYFIDWRMPRMDGLELTRQIKARNDGRPSVVIMITAMDWEFVKIEATEAGVDRHIVKPLFSSSIIDAINECLGTARNHAEGSEFVDGEFAGKRMLLAEDIEINREVLISLLKDSGIIIECAENGLEAYNKVMEAPDKYDVVFMDIQMPKMNGHEATRRIRALPALQGVNLPIIAITANVFKNDIEDCLAAGMDAHLGKPLDIERVYHVLRKFLK
ncbi:MAG: response regulator [Lachnospiraceae bacterium]|nr:response regulator [Lachnospiraceae bacterium]